MCASNPAAKCSFGMGSAGIVYARADPKIGLSGISSAILGVGANAIITMSTNGKLETSYPKVRVAARNPDASERLYPISVELGVTCQEAISSTGFAGEDKQ
jgi:hypothetical protein